MTLFIKKRGPLTRILLSPLLPHFSVTPNPLSTLAPILPATQKRRGETSGYTQKDGRAIKETKSFMKGKQRNVSSFTKDKVLFCLEVTMRI